LEVTKVQLRARTENRLQALRALPELAYLSDSDLRSLQYHFDEVTVSTRTVVARAGQPCTQYVVVLDGRLEMRTNHDFPSVTAGPSCGWNAMCERGLSPATIVATARSRLLVMGRAQFRFVPRRALGQVASAESVVARVA
jgi:hypothetical protein